jgi:hypothetical protein
LLRFRFAERSATVATPWGEKIFSTVKEEMLFENPTK